MAIGQDLRADSENIPGRPYWDGGTEEKQLPREDKVPTCDDCDTPADYRDWSAANSFVVSGPIGPDANFPGQRFETPDQARKYVVGKYTKVFNFSYIPGRWFARVSKPQAV